MLISLQHAFWFAECIFSYPNEKQCWDPYFEEEALAELGFSMEVAVS
jgi:hypothetical protein